MFSSMTWNGVLLPRDTYNPAYVVARDALADAARAGDWETMLARLDSGDSRVTANDWRVGGATWFSPLHQAAWLGAPEKIVGALVRRGAWLSLRDAEGRRPVDIARERGHHTLVRALTPVYEVPVGIERAQALSGRLAELVDEAAARLKAPPTDIRHLDVLCVAERDDQVSFPIPGMYGGFTIEFTMGRLHVQSSNRVVGGSGRAYVLTPDRTTLVDERWDLPTFVPVGSRRV